MRVNKARERWEKVKKLRLLFMSMTTAKEEGGEREMAAYHGQLHPEHAEDPIQRKACIIYPGTYLKAFIETVVAALVLYFSFVTPYKIGFGTDEENRSVCYYELAFDVAMFGYLVLTFFTAYYEDIEVVDGYWPIANRYLRGLFIPDLVSCLPLYLVNPNFMWLKMFRLLRISQVCVLIQSLLDFINKAFSREDKQLLDWNTKLTINRIIQFVLYMIVTCHCIACFWHFVAMKEGIDMKDTWTQGVSMSNPEAYVASLYWTMVTFTTVGYGDITPKTDVEIVVTMVVEFTGILFFAYLMGSVSSIVSNMNQREMALSKRESELEKWLMMVDKNRPDKRLAPELHSSIRAYFLYIWKYDHSFLVNDSAFMMRLPVQLREKLTKHLFADEVESFGAFFGGCEEDFAYQMVLNMFPRKYRKLEAIISEGAFPTELCFIETGSVYLSMHHGSQIAVELPSRSFFGDFEILFGVDVEGLYQ